MTTTTLIYRQTCEVCEKVKNAFKCATKWAFGEVEEQELQHNT